MSDQRFENKVCLVTGAARGIGRAIAHDLHAAGVAGLVLVDRDAAGLEETCRSLGADVVRLVEDVSLPSGADAIVGAAVSRFGRLDVCVNNAAIAPHTALLEERVEVWDMVFAVNTRGTFLMTQRAAQAMIEGGRGGSIVNFSSTASSGGTLGAAAYASSRAATECFSKVAALELAPSNIRVNVVRPGLIDTQPKPLPPAMSRALGERIPRLPLARPGEAREVAEVVLFLASDAASYVTGAVWTVDGGASIGERPTRPVVDDDPRYTWVQALGKAEPGS